MRAFAVLALVACASHAPPPAAPAPVPSALAQLEASRDLAGAPVGHAPGGTPTVAIVFASWCEHCKAELAELDAVRAHHPNVRLLGVNYRGHEDYDGRGSSAAVAAFAARTPWLRVVPIGDDVFAALGSPPAIPTLYVFNSRGTLVHVFDRRAHTPERAELEALLSGIQ